MPSFLSRLSFTRTLLPIIAIIGMVVAAMLVLRSQPDRTTVDPVTTPARAASAFGGRSTVAGTGVVEPSSEIVAIGTHLPGVVQRLYVGAGDQVTTGQPLFRIDDRQARAELAEAEAAIATARAGIANARAALATSRRQLALYSGVEDRRAISDQEVITRSGAADEARTRLAVAEADLAAALARRQSAATALERHTVRAPMAGEILRVRIREGEYANPGGPQGGGDPYLEMGATNPLHVRIDIDEEEIDRVALGEQAVLSPRGASDRRIRAQFVRAEPLIVPKRSLTNAATERVDVRVLQLIYALPATGHSLFVGQQVDAFLPARAEGAKAP